MKLKLKSSARTRERYLLLETNSKEEVEKAILDYLEILGYAKASPSFIKNPKSNIILSINRESINDIRAAFEITNANIKILRVSGTLKGLNK